MSVQTLPEILTNQNDIKISLTTVLNKLEFLSDELTTQKEQIKSDIDKMLYTKAINIIEFIGTITLDQHNSSYEPRSHHYGHSSPRRISNSCLYTHNDLKYVATRPQYHNFEEVLYNIDDILNEYVGTDTSPTTPDTPPETTTEASTGSPVPCMLKPLDSVLCIKELYIELYKFIQMYCVNPE